MRRILPALIAAGLLSGCSGVEDAAASFIHPSDYRPEIQPIGWSADGERVLFVHSELYGGYDHADFRCGGSGVYETDGRGPPRQIAGGAAWCERASTWLTDFSLSADGRTVFAVPHWSGDCAEAGAFDLAARRWSAVARICGILVDEMSVSPDGHWIAARTSCGRRGAGAYPAGCVDRDPDRITLLRADGSEQRAVGQRGDRYPRWSPDGRSLTVQTEGGWNTVVVDVETGSRRVLGRGELPAWSPDAQRLAFIHFPPERGTPISLRVIRADGTGERTVFTQDPEDMRSGPQFPSPGGWPRDPLWSPDGRRIVFTKHFQTGTTLWMVNADGTGLRQLSGRIDPAPSR